MRTHGVILAAAIVGACGSGPGRSDSLDGGLDGGGDGAVQASCGDPPGEPLTCAALDELCGDGSGAPASGDDEANCNARCASGECLACEDGSWTLSSLECPWCELDETEYGVTYTHLSTGDCPADVIAAVEAVTLRHPFVGYCEPFGVSDWFETTDPVCSVEVTWSTDASPGWPQDGDGVADCACDGFDCSFPVRVSVN